MKKDQASIKESQLADNAWRRESFERYVRALGREPAALTAVLFLALLMVFSLGAQWLIPHDPLTQNLSNRLLPPLATNQDTGSWHILGTDSLGRDMLSRILSGAQVSVTVGLLGSLSSGLLGITLGLIAAYKRGIIEDLTMRLVDVMLSLPGLLIGLFVLFTIGPGFVNLILVFALLRWMVYARMTRSMALTYMESDFVKSARALGASGPRVVLRHILPNMASPLIVLATLEVAFLILTEASLSFLGFGIRPPNASWGLMIADGRGFIREAWWLVAFPGVAIMLTSLSLNLFASWLRTLTDPTQRWRLTARREGTG